MIPQGMGFEILPDVLRKRKACGVWRLLFYINRLRCCYKSPLGRWEGETQVQTAKAGRMIPYSHPFSMLN